MQAPEPHEMMLIDLSELPLFLTMKEVGRVLRCSEQSVRRRLRRGKLSYVKDETSVLIPREALRRYLEERLVSGMSGNASGDE